MTPSIAVLITNYNTWDLARQCASEFVRFSGPHLREILIVDDGSTDPAPALPDLVRVLRNPANLGYVGSVNAGFRHLDADLVLLFDSDARPLSDLVPTVRDRFVADPDLAQLGFTLVDERDRPTGAVSPDPRVLELLLGQKLSGWVAPPPGLLCLHSCAIAVRRQAFLDIGGFDEGFDFSDADLDFSLRLHASGWHVALAAGCKAYHTGGGSSQTTAKRVLRHHRNRWRLLQKHDRLPAPALLKAGLAARHLLEYALLQVAGPWLVRDRVARADKLYGRQQLLARVWNGYADPTSTR